MNENNIEWDGETDDSVKGADSEKYCTVCLCVFTRQQKMVITILS